MPAPSVSARACASACGSVPVFGISSTNRIAGAGLKKCRPTIRSGRASPAAIAAIDKDDVLLASTAPAPSSGSSAANTACLASSRSTTASITRSAAASPSTPSTTVTRPSTASRASAVIAPLSTRGSNAARSRVTAVARASALASVAITS